MRWKTNTAQSRVVVRFAWLPLPTADGVTVWLERYDSCESRTYIVNHDGSTSQGWWCVYRRVRT